MDDDDDEEDEEAPYNPKGLPLGWDGKPIPYWLYKLHGLNVRYECEICGNYIYRGPKAFQQHFKEWRHVRLAWTLFRRHHPLPLLNTPIDLRARSRRTDAEKWRRRWWWGRRRRSQGV